MAADWYMRLCRFSGNPFFGCCHTTTILCTSDKVRSASLYTETARDWDCLYITSGNDSESSLFLCKITDTRSWIPGIVHERKQTPTSHLTTQLAVFNISQKKKKKDRPTIIFLRVALRRYVWKKQTKKKNEQVYFLRVVTEHVLHDKSASISNCCYIVVCGLALNWTKPLPGFIFKLSFYNVGPKCTNIITLIGFTCAQCIL